jgi:hypothetical protein
MRGSKLTRTTAALFASAALIAAPAAAAEHYVAKINPLNASKIGSAPSGTASLTIDGDTLTIVVDGEGLPPDMMHLQHYHGFPDGKQAKCPTADADTNGDGYVDLIETEAAAGTTMVPFHAHPATLEIPSDTYPSAGSHGASHYKQTESVAALKKALSEKFSGAGLALDKRVVFLHGVPETATLPQSVQSLPGVPAQVTLPIACGEIEAVK